MDFYGLGVCNARRGRYQLIWKGQLGYRVASATRLKFGSLTLDWVIGNPQLDRWVSVIVQETADVPSKIVVPRNECTIVDFCVIVRNGRITLGVEYYFYKIPRDKVSLDL